MFFYSSRMGDHFVLLVDRLLTESTLEAAIESKNCLKQAMPLASKNYLSSSYRMDVSASVCTSKLVECRICHDEDEESNMEMPCSCCGSLKYAHRKCVQRWCNEKGDTICEICRQHYEPGYTAPPPLFHYGGIPVNLSRNWEISRRDLHDPQFMPMVTSDHEFLNTNFDEYSAPSSRSLICCRVVAIILLMLRIIGILLPIYIMVRAFTAIQRRRHHQDPHFSIATSPYLD
ncbi:uncharacterized protein LOC122302859 isoform X4 [Carya illinoinensis]|nr:uncharacterized protein LOC122302859 isoform X4 [Carya illinoinensis]